MKIKGERDKMIRKNLRGFFCERCMLYVPLHEVKKIDGRPRHIKKYCKV